MIELKVKTCHFCRDQDTDECIYPYYGLAPHDQDPWTENFSPDGDGMGVYTHCLYCGGDGSEMNLSEEVVKSLKEVS